MHYTLTDPALYLKSIGFKLIGLIEIYSDEIQHDGSPEYFALKYERRKRFQRKQSEWYKIVFSSIEHQSKNNGICLYQQKYISKITAVSNEADFTLFRSLLAKHDWT